VVSLAGLAPDAAADSTVVLGGGAGITVNGTYCTSTTIGHDKTGALIGLTAATRGGPGAQIVGEGAQPSLTEANPWKASTLDDLARQIVDRFTSA
jgi:hypothetical protein